MTGRLIHYSAAPLTEVYSVKQETRKHSSWWKPRGLWVSVEGEDDWPAWCEAEQFSLPRLACQTEVVLHSHARILRITNDAEIDRFTKRYAPKRSWPYDNYTYLRWDAVAKKYQGIVIAPYLWERRLHEGCGWYYTWDCASGCVWDAEAVKELRFIEPERTSQKDSKTAEQLVGPAGLEPATRSL